MKRSDLTAGAFVFFLIFAAMWGNFHLDGGRDWDQSQADMTSASRALLEENEWPFWMPYRSGGHDAFADPQSLWLSPMGLLVLVFGFPVGARLFISLAAGFGAIGASVLAKNLGLGPMGRWLFATVLFLSSPVALYTAGGIPQFVLGLAILPWLLLAVEKNTRKTALAAGLLLAVDLYGGDINHFVFHSLFLFLVAACMAMARRTLKPTRWVIIVAISAFVLSAPKFIPTGLLAYENPRKIDIVSHEPGLTPGLIYKALTDGKIASCMEKHHGELLIASDSGELASLAYASEEQIRRAALLVVWINAGAYVGMGVLLLALVGGVGAVAIKMRGNKRPHTAPSQPSIAAKAAGRGIDPRLCSFAAALFLPTLLFFWLSLGVTVTPSAWVLLHELPVFSSLRSPPRLLYYVLPLTGILAASGLEQIGRHISKFFGEKPARAMVAVILALIVADVHMNTRPTLGQAFCEPPVKLDVQQKFRHYHWELEPDRTWYGAPVTPFARAGCGVVNGYGVLPFRKSAVPVSSDKYRGEIFFADATSGTVRRYRFTARYIEVACETQTGGQLVVNQNWAEGWRAVSPADATVEPFPDGRIVVSVPAGCGHVLLRYTPLGLFWGCTVFLIGAPLLVCFFLLSGRPSHRDNGQGFNNTSAR